MIYKTGHTDDPKEYNAKVCSFRLGESHGCISSLACTECGTINTDSICLCGGKFTCIECGFKNGNYEWGNIEYIGRQVSLKNNLSIFGLPNVNKVQYYGSY